MDNIISSEVDLAKSAYNVNNLLEAMEKAGNPVNIIILDACRENPYIKDKSGDKKEPSASGWASIDKSNQSGFYIAFATSPNQKATDSGSYAISKIFRSKHSG